MEKANSVIGKLHASCSTLGIVCLFHFKLILKLSLLILCLQYSVITVASSQPLHFKHPDIGINSPKTTMLQSRNGYLWFGTTNGKLLRYDSYDVVYHGNKKNKIDSRIYSLLEDSHGHLWIGTKRNGLNRLDPITGIYTQYLHEEGNPNSLSNDAVTSLLEDSNGILWIGTWGGLSRFDPVTETFTSYRHQVGNPNSLSSDTISDLVEDSEGRLWIGTWDGGLNRLDPNTNSFKRYFHQSDHINSLSDNVVSSLLEDNKGQLWIGTGGGGVNRFDPVTDSFTIYRYQADNPDSLSDNYISALLEDSQGQLWIGTQGGGLNRFDPITENFFKYRHQPDNPYSLDHDRIYDLQEDLQGQIWVVTNDGVNLLNQNNPFTRFRQQTNNPNSLSNDMINTFLEDSAGRLWIGTIDGLNLFNSATETFTHYSHQRDNPSGLSASNIYALLEDNKGLIWVATKDQGLDLFDPVTETVLNFRHQEDNQDSLSNDSVFAILESQNQSIWFGTLGGGLNCYTRDTEKFMHYRHLKENINSLSSDFVYSLLEDSRGFLWIGTLNGLNRFDPVSKTFTRYFNQRGNPHSLSNNTVYALLEDSQNRLWVGTEGGLNLFDPVTEMFYQYLHQEKNLNSLSNDDIRMLVEDEEGMLWISTHGGGLNRFNPHTETFSSYDSKDGLANIYRFAGIKSKSGELFFGGDGGFIRFYPNNVVENLQQPTVRLTEMKLFYRTVPVNLVNDKANKLSSLLFQDWFSVKPAFSLEREIGETDNITLEHNQDFIGFEFSAMDFAEPNRIQYAFRLVGLNSGWVNRDYKNRHASYPNLTPGRYIFEVKAKKVGGEFGPVNRIHINVLPPPWLTPTAKILYVVIIIGFVWMAVSLIVGRRLNKVLESKVTQRTAELIIANERLEELSFTDQLTGLKNRHYITQMMKSDVELVLRKKRTQRGVKKQRFLKQTNDSDLLFFLIDLDHFKQVNDIYGHNAGDIVLKEIKGILEKVFRETDYLVRWGGEEFLIIARFTERESGAELAERLRLSVLNHHFDIGEGIVLKKTCSIGFTAFPLSYEDPHSIGWEDTIHIADMCMYAAKKTARNAWVGITQVHSEEKSFISLFSENPQELVASGSLTLVSSIENDRTIMWE